MKSPQAPSDERLKDAVAELREGPRELVDLYNDFACPWQQWGLALEMVEIANYSDTAYVAQLWDVYLRQVLLVCLTGNMLQMYAGIPGLWLWLGCVCI